MDASSAPDWDLLPDQPQAFFHLENGFSRTDLKRAYTRLIKVFKPERHPDEFQRIRAAYELLDGQLRHGTTGPSGTPGNSAPPVSPVSPGPDWAPRPKWASSQPEVPQVDALAVLEASGPAALAKALREHRSKNSRAWVQFALLEEELSGNAHAAIAQLLAGIQATGGSPGLFALLWGLVREPHPVADAARLVQELTQSTKPSAEAAAAIGPGAYWHLTEPLWMLLADNVPSAQLHKLLERCHRSVGEEGSRGRLIVSVRLLRRAAPRAEPAWLKGLVSEIQERYSELGDDLQDEVDLALWLHEALDARGALDRTQPPGDLLDAALMAVLAGEEVLADRAFLEAMVWIADHPAEHLAQFDPESTLPAGITGPLHYWGAELSSRRPDRPELDEATGKRRVIELLQRIEHRTDRHWLGKLWSLISFATIGLCFAAVVGPWALLGQFQLMDDNRAIAAAVAVTFAMLIGYFRGLPTRLLGRLWRPMARRLYARLWRAMIAEFFTETPMAVEAFLHHCADVDTPGITNQYHVVLSVDGDTGLELYALARRFL